MMKTSTKLKSFLIFFLVAVLTIIIARHFIGLHFKKKFSVRPAPNVMLQKLKNLFSTKVLKHLELLLLKIPKYIGLKKMKSLET